MKISKSFDCCGSEAPKFASGTNPFDNPGIQPSESKVASTPGESASNSTAAFETAKAQPSLKKGSGYYNK